MSNEIRLLSLAFRTDSAHNLAIARAMKNEPLYAREPMRAKVLVLLHMSIECALKCMIAMEREKKEVEKIYKIIKNGGHNLTKLANAITSQAMDPRLRDRLKKFNPPGVNIRYGFEIMMLTGDDLFSPGRRPEFEDRELDDAFDLAGFMAELANGLHKTTYQGSFRWENGDSPARVIEKIKRASTKSRS